MHENSLRTIMHINVDINMKKSIGASTSSYTANANNTAHTSAKQQTCADSNNTTHTSAKQQARTNNTTHTSAKQQTCADSNNTTHTSTKHQTSINNTAHTSAKQQTRKDTKQQVLANNSSYNTCPDANFKNGRFSRAINNYVPHEIESLTHNGLIPSLELLLTQESNAVKSLQRVLLQSKRAQNPKMYVRNRYGKIYFSKSVEGKEENITTRPKMIYNLLGQELASLTVDKHKSNRDELAELIRNLKRQEQNNLARREISSFNSKTAALELRDMHSDFLTWPEDKILWALKEYETNPAYLEGLIYQGNNGLWLRSKSEKEICNALAERHILFMYEPALSYNGKTHFPDFVIWCDNRKDGLKVIIWEHRGAQHIESYRNNEAYLLNWYEQQGFSRLTNLIVTHEGDVKTRSQINDIINRFVCPSI